MRCAMSVRLPLPRLHRGRGGGEQASFRTAGSDACERPTGRNGGYAKPKTAPAPPAPRRALTTPHATQQRPAAICAPYPLQRSTRRNPVHFFNGAQTTRRRMQAPAISANRIAIRRRIPAFLSLRISFSGSATDQRIRQRNHNISFIFSRFAIQVYDCK